MTDNKHNGGCGCGHDHEHDHEGCGCGCEHDEMEIMNLVLEDGSELECLVLGVFSVEDNEYIALLPKDEEDVLLYGYSENEEGVELISIEEDAEYELVAEAFYELFSDVEDEDYEYDYEDEDEE
ncbi:DUF1292 domain-containing protein [Brassicibacter mesophilus]|jgi:uncharacterized protein YrzB (UPF0473 family)|uniref:DUF1292 domain-containing protein n=1 Tax=Brassicibacter mesophilus TaxID=745119 RepID=UPI003D1AA28D